MFRPPLFMIMSVRLSWSTVHC